MLHLLGSLLKVGDEVVPVLGLLETSEGHLGTRNVLLGVFKVLEEGLSFPSNALVDVGGCVRETLGLTGLSANETVKVRADLVGLASTKGVTLSASGLEDTSTLRSVTRSVSVTGHFELDEWIQEIGRAHV